MIFHKIIRVFLRMLVMIPALLSLLWPLMTDVGLLTAVLGAWFGIAVAEIPILQRLRTRSVIIAASLLIVVSMSGAKALTYFTFFSTLFGPTGALFWRAIVMGGLLSAIIVGAMRILAKRNGAWFALELAAIALSCAVAFFPHQYKIIMRPLWLSDLAWSLGLEPSIALGFIGVLLASLLGMLTVFDRSRRLHVSVLFLPLLALLALIFIDPMQMDTPPPPELLNALKGDNSEQEEQKNDQGSSGQGEADGEEQHLNSGQNEKGQSGGGQAQPVAIMLLSNDYEPPSQYYYLRQEIHSVFNGIRLVMPTNKDLPYEAVRGFPTQEKILDIDIATDFRHNVVADIALLTPHTTPFALESPIRFTPTVNPRPSRFVRTYETESLAIDVGMEGFLDFHIGNSEWLEAEWEHYTDFPDDPRYTELAQSIVETLPENYRENKIAQAFAIKLFLDKQTQYTMSERHNRAKDPTAEFLFGPYKQFIGYCVHTSHAAVFLWRAMGIPARIGIGYATPAEQRRGAAVMILNSDAHSWSELYIEELGWVILDIAPETVLDEGSDPPDMEMLDALEELARAQPDSQFRKAIDWAALWQQWKPTILIVGQLILMGGVLFLYGRKCHRRFEYRWNITPKTVYISALDALSEVGYRRQYGESREAFATRIETEIPTFQRLTWIQLESVLGDPHSIDIQPLYDARRKLSQELRDAVPLWKRVLGFLNPISIYQSK